MTAIQAESRRSNTSYAAVRKRPKVDRHLAGYLSLSDFEETARCPTRGIRRLLEPDDG
jgi:hypothetical protein